MTGKHANPEAPAPDDDAWWWPLAWFAVGLAWFAVVIAVTLTVGGL